MRTGRARHYLKVIHGRKAGRPPRLDFERELALQNALRELIRAGWCRSAHDCSEGGLAVALAESLFQSRGFVRREDRSERGGRDDGSIKFSSTKASRALSFLPCRQNADDDFAVRARASICRRIVSAPSVATNSAQSWRDETLRWPLEEIHDDWYQRHRQRRRWGADHIMKIKESHTYEKVILAHRGDWILHPPLRSSGSTNISMCRSDFSARSRRHCGRRSFGSKRSLSLLVATAVIAATLWVFRRLRVLERFLQVCAWCRKVNVDDEWVSFEQYLKREHDVKSTHGICPTCRANASKRGTASTPAP